MTAGPRAAKPGTVLVTAKNSDVTPAEGVYVFLNEEGLYFGFSFGPTDSNGEVVCDLAGEYGPGDKLEVSQMVEGNVVGAVLGFLILNSQCSGEITVEIAR